MTDLTAKFDAMKITQIGRDDNQKADGLANIGSSIKVTETKQIPLFYLKAPAIEVNNRAVLNNSLTWDWRSPLLSYLLQVKLPSDKNEAQRVMFRAAKFTTVDDELYQRTFTG